MTERYRLYEPSFHPVEEGTTLNDYVLIQPDEPPSMSQGGVEFPESLWRFPRKGTVVDCGLDTDLTLTAGDKVAFIRASCVPLMLGGQELLYVHEKNVLFRIENGEMKPAEGTVIIAPSVKLPEAILLADIAIRKSNEGEVVAVGLGRKLKNGGRAAPLVQTGDRVVFRRDHGIEVKVGPQGFIVIEERWIEAVFEEVN